MKKHMKKWGLSACICMSCIAVFAACEMGMGDTVDLTAPELTLDALILENGETVDLSETSGSLYVSAAFTIKGTARDDKALDRIVVEELSRDGSVRPNESRAVEEADLKPVLLSGVQTASWEANVSLVEEGERVFRFILYDKSQNSSPETSVKYITLIVDKTPPAVEQVEIDRKNGVLYPLKEKDALQALDPRVYTNVNMFQNESFTLKANIKEDYAVSSVVLTLYGDNDEKIIENMPKTGGSNFTAEWLIDHELLTRDHPEYATGRHYLRVEIISRDEKGNENVAPFPYLCWYPESDVPHIEADNSSGETNITGPMGMAVSITVFDDDSLGAVYAKMWTLAEWDAMSGADDNAKVDAVKETAFSANYIANDKIGLLSKTSVLISGSESNMKLVVAVRDKTADGGGGGSLAAKVWTVSYTSNDRPAIVIESPSEGAIPSADADASFTITGYTLDSVGADNVRIAWIPGNDADRIDDAIAALGVSPPPSLSNGIKLWDIAGGMTDDGVFDGFKKKKFSKTFNLLSDFNGEGRNTKLFVFWAARTGGASGVTRTFRLSGNDERPQIEILKPDDIHDSSKSDLTFRFAVTGGIGTLTKTIAEVDGAAVIADIAGDASITWDNGAWTYTIAKNALTGKERAKYEVAVTDGLGNTNKTRRTVVFSSLPALSGISSTLPNNSTAKIGDEILLTAEFTQAVTVTGNPRLRFRFDSNVTAASGDGGWKYAAYKDGSGASTLTFAYTVQKGDTSDKLHTGRAPIDISAGTISALLPGVDSTPAWGNASNSLESKKTLKIDGVPPGITKLEASGKASGWYTTGETITLAMSVNDSVRVNGVPVLKLNAGDASYSYTGTGVVYFTYTAGKSGNVPSVAVTGLEFPGGAGITDYAGNPLEGIAAIAGDVSPATGIDTAPPSAPTVKATSKNGVAVNEALVSGNYKSLEFKVEAPADAGSPLAVTYSLDGGMNWNNPNGTISLPSGAYDIVARATDAAGNGSALPNPVAVEVNGVFPTLAAVTCDKPPGSYPKGAALTFRLIFEGKVYSPSASAHITIGGTETGDSSGITVYVAAVAKSAAANTLDFVYTAGAAHTMTGIAVTAVNLNGVYDLYENSPPSSLAASFPVATQRNVYGKIPEVTKFEVMNGSGSWQDATQNGLYGIGSSGNRQIRLTYTTSVKDHSEVGAEAGVITIRPASGWRIPPVVTQAEFEAISNYTALLDDTQGYKKTTHGLREVSGCYAPDTATKYALAFDKGLDDGALRAQFEAAKYRWQEIDVTKVSITTNAVVVALPDDLAPGVKWTVSVSAGAFSDAAGNTTDALAADGYSFWSAGLSPPVVRVDRTSHDATSVAPALTTRVRIDSETPGANIMYGVKQGAVNNAFSGWNGLGASVSPASPDTTNSDIGTSVLQGVSASTSYTGAFYVGSAASNYYESRKDYVKAEAVSSSDNAALTGAVAGYEGVFRSVVMIQKVKPEGGGKFKAVAMMGSDVEMSVPTISGFPLMDQTPYREYMRQMYMVDRDASYIWNNASTNGGTRFAWVSWEIVSEWSMRTAGYALDAENRIAVENTGPVDGEDWYGNKLQHKWYRCAYGNTTYIDELDYWS